MIIATLVFAELLRFFSGNPVDVKPKLHGPYLVLAGGGEDQDAAMQAAIDGVRGCGDCDTKIDVVVVRASGEESYNPWFMGLKGVNSVATYVITDRASSDRPDVVNAVKNAEFVFFAGGDQCNYVRWIKGTKTADAVDSVYRRGGAVGGTSAGLAIQGEVVYDSCPDQSAKSADVLANPYSVDVSLSRDFFRWPTLRGVLTDTHFVQRDRMGRLLVFLARTMSAGDLRRVEGVGVDAATVLLVDRKGVGRVIGKGPVYVVVADHKAEEIEPRIPLTYRGYKIWKFDPGTTVDLGKLPKKPSKIVDVVKGKFSQDPY